jgi:hypothetical protein
MERATRDRQIEKRASVLDQLTTYARLHITIGEAWHAAEANAIEWIAHKP